MCSGPPPPGPCRPWRESEVLGRRRVAKVVLLDVEHARERHLAAPGRWILRVVDRFHLLDLALGIVLDHQLERPQYGQPSLGAAIEIFAQAVLE
jgi:hypothetical protein